MDSIQANQEHTYQRKSFKAGETVRWWIRSNEDPRWNSDGTATIRLGGGPPREIILALERMGSDFGDHPTDLEWGYS